MLAGLFFQKGYLVVDVARQGLTRLCQENELAFVRFDELLPYARRPFVGPQHSTFRSFRQLGQDVLGAEVVYGRIAPPPATRAGQHTLPAVSARTGIGEDHLERQGTFCQTDGQLLGGSGSIGLDGLQLFVPVLRAPPCDQPAKDQERGLFQRALKVSQFVDNRWISSHQPFNELGVIDIKGELKFGTGLFLTPR